MFPNHTSKKFKKKFRLRFRLPHRGFTSLLEAMKDSHYFSQWDPNKIIRSKQKCSPLSLLLLGTLRYLGRGWTFDDLEEATGINEETHRQFFHKFIEYGKNILYPKFVSYPTTVEEALTHCNEFNQAGMHGAIGSMDACHIVIEKCSHRLKQTHLGGKSKLTCRSYNLTCNHRRQILHTTPGHPARWNDKTIVLFDKLAKDLKNGKIMQDNIFELWDRSGSGELIKVKYRGAWLVVDNGYLNWGVTIPPMKNTLYIAETRWSKWLESMRKDVECTFGILKGRFRILKAGIRLHGVDNADKIWFTCCAIHNMLLDIDCITRDWNNANGLFDFDEESERLPYALQRLANPSERRHYDSSGMGPGETFESDDEFNEAEPEPVDNTIASNSIPDVINNVNHFTADYFQLKLVKHFDILFQQHKIKWPERQNSNVRPCQI